MSKPVDLRNRETLIDAVVTCLSSKVVGQNSDVLAPIAVDAVLNVINLDTATNVDLNDIRIVKQLGGTVDDTELVPGIVFEKGAWGLGVGSRAWPGFGHSVHRTDDSRRHHPRFYEPLPPTGANKGAAGGPTRVEKAKIGLIQFHLSAPKTDMENNVVVSDYAAMDRILREERKYILNLAKKIKKAGCNVLLIQKSILRDAYNDLSLHFLAKVRPSVSAACVSVSVCSGLGTSPDNCI